MTRQASSSGSGSNTSAFMELLTAASSGADLMQVIETIGAQLESATKVIGAPKRVIFAPDTRAPLHLMDPEHRDEAIACIACILNVESNSIIDILHAICHFISKSVGIGTKPDGITDSGN